MTQTDAREHTQPFKHALDGIIFTFKNHQNFRIHVYIALLIIFLGFLLHLRPTDWAVVIFTILWIFMSEMVNTAIEALGDAVTIQYRREIKIAKDISSGMVLLGAIGAVIVGLIIFLPYF